MSPRRAVPEAERSRHPTEVRRRQVARAALDLVAEQGITGVSVRDIARRAGVSPGTVTYHFTGVAQIFAEAITAEIEEYYTPLMAGLLALPPRDALHGLVEGLFTPDTERHWRLWISFWSAGPSHPEFVDRQSARYATWHEQIHGIVTAGRAAGAFTCADADEFTVRFVALVDGLALQWLRGVPPLTGEQARAHLHRLVTDDLEPAVGPAVT